MRKHYDKEFKAKVAIEALRGEKTIQEIATAYAVHPNLVSLWKKQLLENAGKLFEKEGKDKAAEDAERKEGMLYEHIGQLQVENEFLKKKVQATVRDRAEAVEPDHPELSITRQCELLEISRAAYYYKAEEKEEDPDLVVLMAILEELREHPFYGYRKIAVAVAYRGVTRKQVRRIMRKAGLRAICPGKKLSLSKKEHPKYPYLLKDKDIRFPNHAWAADITYIRLFGGYVYLVSIIDIYSRKILAWRVSNTLDSEFCVAALEEAIALCGVPAIMNTDQGCQFTSLAFTSVLIEHGIHISMDSVNRALDNIYIERFWRTLKYEDIFIRDYRTMNELKAGIARYMKFYNSERFHESLGYETPDSIYGKAFKEHDLLEVA